MTITSPDNPLVKQICRLNDSARARKEEGKFVLEGLRLCREAIGHAVIDTLVVTENFLKAHGAEAKLLAEHSAKMVLANDRVIKKMSGTESPQGVVCVCLIPKIDCTIDKKGKYIALENVADPANLGAVARTAEALGINGVIVSADSVDKYNPKALRASMGALIRLPVIELEYFLPDIKSTGMPVYACVVDSAAKPINTVDFSGGAIAMIGNEANGLTPKAQSTGTKVHIPMLGPTESLNAATAAAIVMWEMMR